MKLIFHTIALLFILLFTGICSSGGIDDGHTIDSGKLTESKDLAADATLARNENRLLVLLISQEHCPYCLQIKRQILEPMILGGDHQGEILIRELFIDTGNRVRHFTGETVNARSIARHYGVQITPTLLFLDPDGQELTEPLVGIQTPEMFFFYVDQSIRNALRELNGENHG